MEFDECLIELVRSRPELYDMSDRRYSDAARKDAIWREIGDEMGRPGPECKRRWVSLRDQFRKNVNKNTRSGQATVPKKTWKYENTMAFLRPFLQERETISNINVDESFEEEGVNEEPFTSEDTVTGATEEVSSLPAVQTCIPSASSNSTTRGVKRKQAPDSASATLMRYIVSTQNKDDAIDNFMASIGSTLKKLSPLRQLQAKDKIYNIVSALELEQLVESANGM